MVFSARQAIFKVDAAQQIHYASAGDPASTTIILFFSGMLSVGSATDDSIAPCLEKAHYIAPTLPGNGKSTSTPHGVAYNENLCKIITALLEHLHPSESANCINDLYIAGGSYGSVMAQMLYGADFSRFPFGRCVRGMLLGAPFSPFLEHKTYAQHMTWSNWISVGPPSQLVPFRLIPRVLQTVLARRCRDIEGATALLDAALFAKMDSRERQMLADYAKKKRKTAEDVMVDMAEGTLECTKNWDGFIEGSDVLHSDWGFRVGRLTRDRRSPVLI